jgi:4-carboxymuconolactone decarboxylase
MARIPYVDKVNASAEVQAIFNRLEHAAVPVFGRPFVLNVMRALAHAPVLLRRVSSLGNAMLNDLTLDPKLRELAVLQLFRINRCDYGFQQHVTIGKAAGLNDKQIANVGAYRTYPYYADVERLVLEYAEAVTRDVAVSEELFARIRQQFSDQQIVELTMVIAYWNMMSRFLMPLQVEIERAD